MSLALGVYYSRSMAMEMHNVCVRVRSQRGSVLSVVSVANALPLLSAHSQILSL